MSNLFDVMGGTLQRHAYTNVWCTPNQDNQTIIQPARLTPDRGVMNNLKVMWQSYTLPESNVRFHVYQIGNIHPNLIGLLNQGNAWTKFSEACSTIKLIADIYTAKGIQIHRSEVWYRFTSDKDLIIAVKFPDPVRFPANLDAEPIFVRLYSNAYYQSIRTNSVTEGIFVTGTRVSSNQNILDFQNLTAVYEAKVGHTYYFLNGKMVNTISLLNAGVGDAIEMVHDGSIKTVIRFPMSGVPSFHSSMDNAQKYLLHYAGVSDLIDYQDDIDFYLVKPDSSDNAKYAGIYYHKNSEGAVRMVTHKDYSVKVNDVAYFAGQQAGWTSTSVDMILFVRKSGYDRPLVFVHNRIKDLYKLPDAEVQAALVGVDATVSVWNADALEASGYCALMRAELGTISTEMVQNAYGYNAVSQLIGNTPSVVRNQSGVNVVDVPVGLQVCSTAYEYDATGKLLEWHQHTTGTNLYATRNLATSLVEMVFGFASGSLEEYYGNANVTLSGAGFNYRFYMCGQINGVPDNAWVDVTDSNYYFRTGNAVQWLLTSSQYGLIRGNKNHLTYDFTDLAADGPIRFNLRSLRLDLNDYRTLGIPLGELDIILNGKALVKDVDYIIKFPEVCIFNKEYLVQPGTQYQKVTIRFTGFCDAGLQMTAAPDCGFVEYGVLSHNTRYDLRDDKVNRIICRGLLYRMSDLRYGEGNFTVAISDSKNGSPYLIRDIVVPMNDYLVTAAPVIDKTYTLRARSQLVDQEISDYMTLKLPEVEPSQPSAITSRYAIISPFVSKIMWDLKNGVLWNAAFTTHLSDMQVAQYCAPYLHLLEFDPTQETNKVDDKYVVIHPHQLSTVVRLNIYMARFLHRVVTLYTNDKVNLSNFISIDPF
jgi:DUF2075 family protein